MDLRTLMTMYSLIPGAPGAQNVQKMWTPGYWNNIANGFLNTKPGASTATPRRPSVPKPAPTYPSTNIPKVKPIPNAVPGPWNKPVPIPNAVPGPWNKPVPIPNAPVPKGSVTPVQPPTPPSGGTGDYYPKALRSRFDGINWNLWGNRGIRNTLTNPNSGNKWNALYESYKGLKKRNDITNRGFQDWIDKEHNMPPVDHDAARRQWIEGERQPFDINEATKQWIEGERNLWK